jgi:hypothetical protein
MWPAATAGTTGEGATAGERATHFSSPVRGLTESRERFAFNGAGINGQGQNFL